MDNLLTLIPSNEQQESLDGEIRVSKMRFEYSERTTWERLFSGFHEIRVMTYSYSLPFITKLMKLFERGEVIIGFNKLIDKDLADLFAIQEYTINYVTKNRYLQKRIAKDEVEFFVVDDFTSHQKVYLLKSDSGKVRTIIGSGNVVEKAWNGSQPESFIYCDDYTCYAEYLRAYEMLKAMSTNRISKDAQPILEDKGNAEELPIIQKIMSEHAVIVDTSKTDEEKDFVFNIGALSKEWREKLDTVKLKASFDGKTLIDTVKVKALLTGIKKDNRILKEKQKIMPQLTVDYENKGISFNEKKYDLHPEPAELASDIENLLEYMDGFSNFTGDTKRLKTLYWKVLNYMFLSPFIAKFRYVGSLYGYDQRFFPMYMLIYGDSDAGKTKFIELVQKMMLERVPHKLKKETFSYKPMATLKTEVKGCPVLIDEITPTYWKYAKDIVKFDDSLIEERILNHPTFILISNDIKDVRADLSKRIICINVDNRLNKTDAALNDRKVFHIRKAMGTAFYREYVRRMFQRCDVLLDEIHDHEQEEGDGWFPDLFKTSSEILRCIFEEMEHDIPNELTIFTWFDYMGDAAISEKATAILSDIYRYNRGIIKVNRKKNELEFNFDNYDERDAKIKVNTLHSELPAALECKVIGKRVVLRLDKAEELIGIRFQNKRLWW